MALSAWQATIVNESGDVIPSAQIQVINDATGLNADIFANSGGTPAANPFTATAGGFAQFYANAGTYRVIASDSGTGFSETWEDQRIGDAQARDTGTGADQVPTNGDLPNFGTAAEVDTGTASVDVPTNANLSAAVCGTATFSSDVYTFTPSGTGFRPLQAGMYLSFKLPSGSANTTTTPDINYNGSTYVIKWINGSALVADDLEETYNKQPILFYFDGTDMLIASNIGGLSGSVYWYKETNGKMEMNGLTSLTTSASAVNLFGTSAGTVYSGDTTVSFPKTFTAIPRTSLDTYGSVSNLATVGRLATITGFEPRVWSQSNSTSYDVSFTATGRWY